jgi:hypothetical protein
LSGQSGNRADRSRSHGYEKEWEETHCEQEGQSPQDGVYGRAAGSQDRTRDGARSPQDRAQDQRQKESPIQETCGQARNRAEDGCKENRAP